MKDYFATLLLLVTVGIPTMVIVGGVVAMIALGALGFHVSDLFPAYFDPPAGR